MVVHGQRWQSGCSFYSYKKKTISGYSNNNPEEVTKRIRAINKKLKAANQQREDKANGKELNVDQEAKIAAIPEMEKELAELEAWREQQQQQRDAAEQHDRGEPSESLEKSGLPGAVFLRQIVDGDAAGAAREKAEQERQDAELARRLQQQLRVEEEVLCVRRFCLTVSVRRRVFVRREKHCIGVGHVCACLCTYTYTQTPGSRRRTQGTSQRARARRHARQSCGQHKRLWHAGVGASPSRTILGQPTNQLFFSNKKSFSNIFCLFFAYFYA